MLQSYISESSPKVPTDPLVHPVTTLRCFNWADREEECSWVLPNRFTIEDIAQCYRVCHVDSDRPHIIVGFLQR